MATFHEVLREVCLRPEMFVGSRDFRLVGAYLNGYDGALYDQCPDLHEGLGGEFPKWLAVRLDSCVRSGWDEIILREHPGADHFEILERLYGEYARDRSEGKLDEILEQYKGLGWNRDRTCWCELPMEERDQWRPGYRRP